MCVSWISFSISIKCGCVYPSYSLLLTEGLQVYAILDEIFLAGEIEETSKDVVLSRLEELEKLE
jgi:hypothetical protein